LQQALLGVVTQFGHLSDTLLIPQQPELFRSLRASVTQQQHDEGEFQTAFQLLEHEIEDDAEEADEARAKTDGIVRSMRTNAARLRQLHMSMLERTLRFITLAYVLSF
jgi:hypothetical protein